MRQGHSFRSLPVDRTRAKFSTCAAVWRTLVAPEPSDDSILLSLYMFEVEKTDRNEKGVASGIELELAIRQAAIVDKQQQSCLRGVAI